MPRQSLKAAEKKSKRRATLDAGAGWDAAPAGIRRLRAAGRPADALAALREAIAEDPARAWAYALSAELKAVPPVDKFSEALEDFEKAAKLEPRAAWILGSWARALARAGRAVEAETLVERAVALEPDAACLLAERALIRLDLGRAGEALADAEASAEREPGAFAGQWALAQALLRAGRAREALAAADGALAARERGAEDGGARVDSLRFECLRSLERWGEACDALLAAVARGERLSWSEGGAAGRDELEAARRARPKSPWPLFWKGELSLRAGRPAEAAADFTRALALDGGHLWSRAWRAWARAQDGDARGAAEDLDAALELKRHEAYAALEAQLRALRGELFLKAKDFRAAEADFSRALAVAPPSARLHLRRAEAGLGLGRAADAERDLRAALESDAACRRAYALRAGLRSRRGDLEGSLSDLRRARLPGGSVEAGGLRWVKPRARPAPPPRSPGRGRVLVDPRIELAGLLKLAVDRKPAPDFAAKRAPELAAYVAEAERKLLPHAGPELLARFRSTAAARGNAAFPWLGVTQMMMDVSPAPELRPLTAAWRDGEDLSLLRHLRQFVEKSRFLEFLEAHEPLFARWTKPLRATVEAEDYARAVSDYVGVEIDAYYDLVLSPLLRDVGLRAILRGEDGTRGARTVLCPLTSPAHLESVLAPKAEDLLWTGWHEMLHLVLDPWCDFYAPEAAEFERLYAGVPKMVRRKNWMDCFSEHHVRAATQRLLRLRKGAAAQEALAEIDRAEGYSYQDALADKLAEYESARERYPALADFLPEWFKVWRTFR